LVPGVPGVDAGNEIACPVGLDVGPEVAGRVGVAPLGAVLQAQAGVRIGQAVRQFGRGVLFVLAGAVGMVHWQNKIKKSSGSICKNLYLAFFIVLVFHPFGFISFFALQLQLQIAIFGLPMLVLVFILD
jgi:hypothetical protein